MRFLSLFLLFSCFLSLFSSILCQSTVSIYFCNFFPVPGSLIVYNFPSTAILSSYYPTKTYSVNYGECEYLVDFAPAAAKFSVAARLEFPLPGVTPARYFLTSTPFFVNVVSEGVGTNDQQKSFLTYSVNQTLRDVPLAPTASALNQNPETENQNIFIASPLVMNPFDLTQGFRIESIMPPFAVRSPSLMVSPVLEVPALGNPKLVRPMRMFLANFAPGNLGNSQTFNVPSPYDGTLDAVYVGGGAPNFYWYNGLDVKAMNYSRFPPYYGVPGGLNVDIVTSPQINFQTFAPGQTVVSSLGFGAFAPMMQIDLSVSAFNEDPGFYLMLCTAGSDRAPDKQIAQPWWIHSNFPAWSVNLYTVYGLGTQEFPYRSRVFTFSLTRQKQIRGFQLFMNNAITFAQKNGLSLNIFTSTQFTQMVPFLRSSAPALRAASLPWIATIAIALIVYLF